MKNKRIWLGMLVLILVFGMTVVGNANAQGTEVWTEGHFTFRVAYGLKMVDGEIVGDSSASILDYSGPGGNVQIPAQSDGLPVRYIYDGAFEGKGLTSISIPNSVREIGERAFAGNQLTNVTIPNGVTHIGGAAFAANRLTNVTIPNGVTHIEEYAFVQNQLTNVTIPNGVTHIGTQAFAGNQLTNVTIPSSVTHIGDMAFAMNRLTSVTVPSGTQIGENAFVRNGPNNDREATVTRR